MHYLSSVPLIFLTFVLQYLASVGGCLKRLNNFAEGDSFYFDPQIISESQEKIRHPQF